MTYEVKKLEVDFKILEPAGDATHCMSWSGTSWGVFKDGELVRVKNRYTGQINYEVYGTKKIAQHQADSLTRRLELERVEPDLEIIRPKTGDES